MDVFPGVSQCTCPSQEVGATSVVSPCTPVTIPNEMGILSPCTPDTELASDLDDVPATADGERMFPLAADLDDAPRTPDVNEMCPCTPDANDADCMGMPTSSESANLARRRISGKSKPPAAYVVHEAVNARGSNVADDALAQEAMVELTALASDAQRQHVHWTHVRTYTDGDRQPDSFTRAEFFEHMAAVYLLYVLGDAFLS